MQLADRIKMYEKMETSSKFMPGLPIYTRIDGRSFSNFTKNMKKPFDVDMSQIMQSVTSYLVKQTGASIGYTQSDEISLVFYQKNPQSEVFFNGKKQKMVSVLSALATAKFVQLALQYFPDECEKSLPVFDCRVFQLPSKAEASNCFLWRYQDAIRNSIQMAGYAEFSHNEMDRKNQSDVLDMLIQRGINWNEYPAFFKEGSFFKRVQYTIKGTDGEDVIRHKIDQVRAEDQYNDRFGDISTDERIEFIFGNE